MLEAQARQQSDDYMGVCCLKWVADALGVKQINGRLNPCSIWQSLALLQKHQLASITMSLPSYKERALKSIMDEIGGLPIKHNESIK